MVLGSVRIGRTVFFIYIWEISKYLAKLSCSLILIIGKIFFVIVSNLAFMHNALIDTFTMKR